MRARAGLCDQFDIPGERRGFRGYRDCGQAQPGRDSTFVSATVTEQIVVDRLNDDQRILSRCSPPLVKSNWRMFPFGMAPKGQRGWKQ